MSDAQYIKVNIENRIAVVTIDHPPANALSRAVMEELDRALDALAADEGVKAVIVTGAGAFVFVAGADIKELDTIESGEEAGRLAAAGTAVINKLERMPKPTIAAINGMCFGGGLELAMACHLRVCGDRARLGQLEINLGIIPGFGGTQRLPRLVGRAKAIELTLLGEPIGAKEALGFGLVNLLVPNNRVVQQARALAEKILAKGQVAVQAALRAIVEGTAKSLEDGLRLENELFTRVASTADRKEGIRAFLEKRQAKFQDR